MLLTVTQLFTPDIEFNALLCVFHSTYNTHTKLNTAIKMVSHIFLLPFLSPKQYLSSLIEQIAFTLLTTFYKK